MYNMLILCNKCLKYMKEGEEYKVEIAQCCICEDYVCDDMYLDVLEKCFECEHLEIDDEESSIY